MKNSHKRVPDDFHLSGVLLIEGMYLAEGVNHHQLRVTFFKHPVEPPLGLWHYYMLDEGLVWVEGVWDEE